MINVIICSHERPAFLSEILLVLNSQTLRPRVIIVDDSGYFNTQPVADKIIWNNPDGLYHRVAKFNEGMQAVKNEPVILLDDDAIPQSRRYIQAFQDQLDRSDVDIIRGVFGNEYKLPPWFSTVNLCMRFPILFDPAYDGVYGFEDVDLGLTFEKMGLKVETGDPDTSVEHVGQPFSGDRASMIRNEIYYKAKWHFD